MMPNGLGGMYQEHALPKASRKLVAAGHGMLDNGQHFLSPYENTNISANFASMNPGME